MQLEINVENKMTNEHSVCTPIQKCNTTWQRIAVWIALLSVCALPVQADDTEVYINPSTTDVIPNIMLILDLSGSMGWAPDGNTNPPEGGAIFSLWLPNSQQVT